MKGGGALPRAAGGAGKPGDAEAAICGLLALPEPPAIAASKKAANGSPPEAPLVGGGETRPAAAGCCGGGSIPPPDAPPNPDKPLPIPPDEFLPGPWFELNPPLLLPPKASSTQDIPPPAGGALLAPWPAAAAPNMSPSPAEANGSDEPLDVPLVAGPFCETDRPWNMSAADDEVWPPPLLLPPRPEEAEAAIAPLLRGDKFPEKAEVRAPGEPADGNVVENTSKPDEESAAGAGDGLFAAPGNAAETGERGAEAGGFEPEE